MPSIDILLVEKDPKLKSAMCDAIAKAGLTVEVVDKMPEILLSNTAARAHCVIARTGHFDVMPKAKSDKSDQIELNPVVIGLGDKSSLSFSNAVDLLLAVETPNESVIEAAKCLIANRKNETRIKLQVRSFNERLSKVTRLETLGMLASEFSHDVKNFSFIAEYNSARLEKTLKENYWDDKIEKRLLTIRSNIDRISTLAKQILDYSQENENDKWEALNLHTILEEVASYFGYGLEHRSTGISTLFAEEKFTIKGLRLDILRLFMNLLNNAREAVEGKTGSWVRIETHRHKNNARIKIIDSGEGIPQVFQEKIMTPFFTTKKETKGTGIGLSIAKEIVEKYKGSIFVDRTYANTCFCVDLPLEI